MGRRTKENQSAAAEYVAGWRALIDVTRKPSSLLKQWQAERDQRDELAVPIAQRLDLLRLIAPDEVYEGPPAP